jgi:type IV secretion system protein VirD4
MFERASVIAAGGGVAGALFAILTSIWRARQKKLVTTYGSAAAARAAILVEGGGADAAAMLPRRVRDTRPGADIGVI